MKDTTNPYTPPSADLAERSDDTLRFEAIRREHINHEASVRSVGSLYYLSAFFLLVGAAVVLRGDFMEAPYIGIELAVVYSFFALVIVPLGRGMRKLRSWAKVPVTILSCFGLLAFPIGTIINGYIIYLVWCRKGEMVFSTQYQKVIEQTPHVKYRISIVVWIILAIIIIGILAAAIASHYS